MKKILILGSSSFSGASFANYLHKKNYNLYGTYNKKKSKIYSQFDKSKNFKINLLIKKDRVKLSL